MLAAAAMCLALAVVVLARGPLAAIARPVTVAPGPTAPADPVRVIADTAQERPRSPGAPSSAIEEPPPDDPSSVPEQPRTVSDFLDRARTQPRSTKQLPGGVEIVKTFLPDGQPWEEYSTRDGLLDGVARTWLEDGQLAELVTYSRGRKDGRYESWHPEGTLAYSGSYVRGKKAGTWQHWRPNGEVESVLEYGPEGKLHGTCTFWSDDGEVDESLSGAYEDGRKMGGR